jgi:hypothetical protein
MAIRFLFGRGFAVDSFAPQASIQLGIGLVLPPLSLPS